MRIAVVGAGFGGLAAAIRLQALGHQVSIYEKQDQAGGRAAVFQRDGFTFDAGPTIITAPQLIGELFAIAGERMDDHVRLVPLDPFYRVRFEDGTYVDWTADDDRRDSAIARLNPGDVAGARRFASEARRVFDLAYPLIDQPFDSAWAMLRSTPSLVRARSWQSVAGMVERFVKDTRVRQLLSFHPLLVGGNPFTTPSIYALIPELERRWGVWFAMGGTGALIQALVRLFDRLGGRLHLQSAVAGLEIGASGRASAILLASGGRVPVDAVVSNADVVHTYRDLVPRHARRVHHDLRLERWRQGMSVFVLYFGTNRRYDGIAHHEILLGPRYRGLLDDVFRRRELADDFSLYLHRPTATDASLAPAGCDAFYVLSPVPILSPGIDWASAASSYRDRIVRHLQGRLLPDLSRHIVTETSIDPRYFRDALNSDQGNAFSLQPLLTQSAWFRPHVRSEDVPNLYLTGAGTHPGAGIPGVISSAAIVARMIGPAPRQAGVREAPGPAVRT